MTAEGAPSSIARVDALSPSRELEALVAQGDLRRAGEWLVARHAREVIALCRSMVRERALAEDLAQDVFAQAFSHLGGYRAEAAPRTWLFAIARNRCIDHLRRSEREPWDDGDDDVDGFADDAPLPPELLLRRGDVDHAFDQLEENERALIVLRFRHGMEYPELASVFGLKEGTVRMRLSRALGKMRARLEQRDALEAAVMAESCAAPIPPPAAARPRAVGAPPPPGAPPPLAAPQPPSAAMPAFGSGGGAPPPPPSPAPARASAAGVAKAKGGGGWLERLRAFFSGAPEELVPAEPPPATPFAQALSAREVEPGEAFTAKLAALLRTLPGR